MINILEIFCFELPKIPEKRTLPIEIATTHLCLGYSYGVPPMNICYKAFVKMLRDQYSSKYFVKLANN